ncbi:hypothetical protein LQ567_07805 [Niabella pedocola]|uniref:DUF3604 domain-containing protein n=1 Tax=Niabella pedocola TaxID=1752077 RepID=A0ABS8PNJ8_9BACT|nr:hypothetical protein [Niabella pedocola]MCD2422660.1 hypothetical protein [Niabella pedocola]
MRLIIMSILLLVSCGAGAQAAGKELSFRIVFGLRDKEPAAWNGQVIPAAGQELSVQADWFRDHQYEAKGWSKGIISIKLPDPPFPNDYLPNSSSWICSTRPSPLHGPTTEWHDHGQLDSLYGEAALKPVIVCPSIILRLKNPVLTTSVSIKTARGDFHFVPDEIIKERVAYFLDSSIRVEVVPVTAPITTSLKDQEDYPALLIAKNGTTWLARQAFDGTADKLVVQCKRGSVWLPSVTIAEHADIFSTALAEDEGGHIWVVWAMQVKNRFDLYTRRFDGSKWSAIQCLTTGGAVRNLYHRMTTDSRGNIWLVWQQTGSGNSRICARQLEKGVWKPVVQVSNGASAGGNNWWPVVAAAPNGTVSIAWDGYAKGSYDIYLRQYINGKWQAERAVIATGKFEAHPSIAYDQQNRLWLAWDESGENWGKDVGFLLDRQQTRLHESRSVKLICLDGDRVLTTRQPLSAVLAPKDFWELPQLQIDAQGNPWLLVRHLVMREPDTPLEGPIDLALFEIQALQYVNGSWSPPVCVPQSAGRNDMLPATAIDADGNIWAAWATDLRNRKTYQHNQLQVALGEIGKWRGSNAPELAAYNETRITDYKPFDPLEKAAVQRIRNYRIQNGTKQYAIYRGDLHRHTDISVDGSNDGSILDAYRYARDAAALDFLGVSNHTDAVWDEYNWWNTQKLQDLYQIPDAFVSFYGYERSVEYPNGHRNIFFTKRGTPYIYPIGAFEARGGYVGSGALYWYLRRHNGFSIPHTTGRTSGTDWRDNDPLVEPLMEIYQGMRDSYEYAGSPRPYKRYTLPDSTQPVGRASSAPRSPSFKPLGFAWNALAKGYKLGFIASSDHISTHLSYACLIAESLTPEGLGNAIRNRRTYAATDNIILDIKHTGSAGTYLMGASFISASPIRISGTIIGTAAIEQVDIIRNNAVVQTYKPGTGAFEFVFKDTRYQDKKDGESYYYVRVIQQDGAMAWGSPVWVTYTK